MGTVDRRPRGVVPGWTAHGWRRRKTAARGPSCTLALSPLVLTYSVGNVGRIRPGETARLVAAQVRDEDPATSRAACAGGFVVPAPAANPGLVRDCETLITARAVLARGPLANWGSGSPLALWRGVNITVRHRASPGWTWTMKTSAAAFRRHWRTCPTSSSCKGVTAASRWISSACRITWRNSAYRTAR